MIRKTKVIRANFLSGRITSARLNLAYMFRDANDVEKDIFKSYVWFLIYNENKRDFSVFQQDDVVQEIKDIENVDLRRIEYGLPPLYYDYLIYGSTLPSNYIVNEKKFYEIMYSKIRGL